MHFITHVPGLLLTLALVPDVSDAQSLTWGRVLYGDTGATAARLKDTVKLVDSAGKKAPCPERPAAEPVTIRPPDEERPNEEGIVKVKGTNGNPIPISVVKKSMLAKIQEAVTHGNGIAPPGGWKNTCTCRERAHWIGAKLAERLNIETGKQMVRAGTWSNIKPRIPYPRPAKSLPISWPAHYASFVMVDEENGKPPVKYIIDPAMFPEGPVPEATWETRLPGIERRYVTNRFAIDTAQSESNYQSYSTEPSNFRSIEMNRQRLVSQDGLAQCR